MESKTGLYTPSSVGSPIFIRNSSNLLASTINKMTATIMPKTDPPIRIHIFARYIDNNPKVERANSVLKKSKDSSSPRIKMKYIIALRIANRTIKVACDEYFLK